MVLTKIRSTKLKKLTPRRRVTRLKPLEYVSATEAIEKRRIIPIPIPIPTKVKIKPATKIKPSKGTIIGGGGIEGGKRLGPMQGGPVNSSVAVAVWYWARSMLMVIDFHGGAQYEYYQVQFDLFNYIYNGLGTATTDGENQYGKWWKGKSNPSVGASIYRRLQSGMVRYRRVK